MRYANEQISLAMHTKLVLIDIEQRLFKEKYSPRTREASHEVLRALKHKIPT